MYGFLDLINDIEEGPMRAVVQPVPLLGTVKDSVVVVRYMRLSTIIQANWPHIFKLCASLVGGQACGWLEAVEVPMSETAYGE